MTSNHQRRAVSARAPQARASLLAELAAMIANRILSARVGATFGIDHIKDSIAAATTGKRDGKVLLMLQRS